MSIDITAPDGRTMNVKNVAWRFILEAGRQAGWKPEGTQPPIWVEEGEAWDASYDPAQGQQLSASDSKSLGDAIQSTLSRDNCKSLLMKAAAASALAGGYDPKDVGEINDETIEMFADFVELATNSDGLTIE